MIDWYQTAAAALAVGVVSFAGVCQAQTAEERFNAGARVATQQCVNVARQFNPTFDAYFDGAGWHEWTDDIGQFYFRRCLVSKGFGLGAGRSD